jgi:uncharacterized glyoxalase superfamily protein PhnB
MDVRSLTPNLTVPDVEAAVDWYADVFDAEVVATLPADADTDYFWAQVVLDGAPLMFQQRESLEAKIPVLADRSTEGPSVLYIDVDDARAMHEQLRSHGVDIVQPPEETDYGWRLFAATDPNGYVLWFGERLDEEDAEPIGVGQRTYQLAADRNSSVRGDIRHPPQERERWG